MKFNAEAEVYSADGKKLGHLGRVVLNPHTRQVTDIVVHKGYFFTKDKVIPVKAVQQTLESRITLHSSAELDAYPDYMETHFIPLVGDDETTANLPSPVLWYPPLGAMVYNPIGAEVPYVVRETENIPLGTQALAIGSDVITSNDEHVGHVQEVFMDSGNGQSSHILVADNTLLHGEKLVPTSWIRQIEANAIHLSVGMDMMMSLPDYARQP